MPRTRREVLQLRVHGEALAEARRVAEATGLPVADVLRQALSIGVPLVEQRAKEPRA